MSNPGTLVEAAALLTEVPRFTPAQWQRLFWDAGLKGSSVHLFLRHSVPHSPWSMVVDTGDGVVDLEAFDTPVPAAHFLDATVKGPEDEDALLAQVKSHTGRIEIAANDVRCPPERAHEFVARAASAILRSTYGIAWLHTGAGILASSKAVSEQTRELGRGRIPVELYLTVRETSRGPMRVVDTVGLPAFDLPDLEIEVDADDAADARAFLSRVAGELIAKSVTLGDGTTLEGPLGLRWKAAPQMATLAPRRQVLRFQLAG